jgi:glyoxylase-like metal-dependent hydrolase (beta-lactamase superfamily II)
MEIIPGVNGVIMDGLGVGQVYLYQEADRITLVDAGAAGNGELIVGAIEAMGRRPEDLAQAFITHYHNDHVGSLAHVVERTDAEVLAHALDAPVIRGERDAEDPVLSGWEKELHDQVAEDMESWPPARVDRELADGDEIDLEGGARVVHVPGHTPGSIALYVPKRRLLFAGDAAASVEGNPIVGVFNLDREQTRASFRKLAELDFEVACFGHGAPLDKEASLAFRRLAERIGQ